MQTIYAITVTPRLNTSDRHCMPLMSLYIANGVFADFEERCMADVFFEFIETKHRNIDIYRIASECKDINLALYLLD